MNPLHDNHIHTIVVGGGYKLFPSNAFVLHSHQTLEVCQHLKQLTEALIRILFCTMSTGKRQTSGSSAEELDSEGFKFSTCIFLLVYYQQSVRKPHPPNFGIVQIFLCEAVSKTGLCRNCLGPLLGLLKVHVAECPVRKVLHSASWPGRVGRLNSSFPAGEVEHLPTNYITISSCDLRIF